MGGRGQKEQILWKKRIDDRIERISLRDETLIEPDENEITEKTEEPQKQ